MQINHSLVMTLLVFSLVYGLTGCSVIYERYGGPYLGSPEDAFSEDGLDEAARKLISAAFKSLEGKRLQDYHVHYFGNSDANTLYQYCTNLNQLPEHDRPRLNFERMIHHQKLWHRPFVKGVYLDTLDITDIERMDDQYMERLVDLVAHYGSPDFYDTPKSSPYATDFYLMAMDGMYDADGKRDPKSFAYVPNRFVVELAQCLNSKFDDDKHFGQNRFKVIGSIHPYRKETDWLKEIKYLNENQVHWIKWRPPSMNINPSLVDEKFYQALINNGIGIMTHTGESQGVILDDQYNQLASPEKMRRAINLGVKVVFLHLGRVGKNSETDEAYSDEAFRMIDEYSGKQNTFLGGEISAVPYDKSYDLLERIAKEAYTERHPLWFNGSDYPAVTPYRLVKKSLKKLQQKKWLNRDQVNSLDSIYKYNPLLFDFVLKRTLHKKGAKIPDAVFLGGQVE